ncbi:MAG: hypothetical protein JETT_2126 [Candidatus Jettenia ecosi]|uniref:Uncharacterized protein n=1 Tax=Candidatus Jettenia ecosi TaxID=2494326 RepID=A0A533QB67_9BACT|nr:MAG: hypothetical protein JETT_2126 [Candidatus Jettenia ecosi]
MGHKGMTIGLWNFRDTKQCTILSNMLAIPFLGKVGGYTIDRHK